jgi:hypothetical protein
MLSHDLITRYHSFYWWFWGQTCIKQLVQSHKYRTRRYRRRCIHWVMALLWGDLVGLLNLHRFDNLLVAIWFCMSVCWRCILAIGIDLSFWCLVSSNNCVLRSRQVETRWNDKIVGNSRGLCSNYWAIPRGFTPHPAVKYSVLCDRFSLATRSDHSRWHPAHLRNTCTYKYMSKWWGAYSRRLMSRQMNMLYKSRPLVSCNARLQLCLFRSSTAFIVLWLFPEHDLHSYTVSSPTVVQWHPRIVSPSWKT